MGGTTSAIPPPPVATCPPEGTLSAILLRLKNKESAIWRFERVLQERGIERLGHLACNHDIFSKIAEKHRVAAKVVPEPVPPTIHANNVARFLWSNAVLVRGSLLKEDAKRDVG